MFLCRQGETDDDEEHDRDEIDGIGDKSVQAEHEHERLGQDKQNCPRANDRPDHDHELFRMGFT